MENIFNAIRFGNGGVHHHCHHHQKSSSIFSWLNFQKTFLNIFARELWGKGAKKNIRDTDTPSLYTLPPLPFNATTTTIINATWFLASVTTPLSLQSTDSGRSEETSRLAVTCKYCKSPPTPAQMQKTQCECVSANFGLWTSTYCKYASFLYIAHVEMGSVECF